MRRSLQETLFFDHSTSPVFGLTREILRFNRGDRFGICLGAWFELVHPDKTSGHWRLVFLNRKNRIKTGLKVSATDQVSS
jgi:hypothetical protein